MQGNLTIMTDILKERCHSHAYQHQ